MDPLDELKQLVYVAHEHSRDSQLELLWRITGVLLHDPGSYSDHQRLCFGEIMEKLAYDLEQEIRAELSHMIATEALAPHRLCAAWPETRSRSRARCWSAVRC